MLKYTGYVLAGIGIASFALCALFAFVLAMAPTAELLAAMLGIDQKYTPLLIIPLTSVFVGGGLGAAYCLENR